MKIKYLEDQIAPELLSKNNLNINLESQSKDDYVSIQEIQRIGTALQKCSHLKKLKLNLDFNKIGKKGALHLGQGLSSCINLKILILGLRCNQIGAQGILNLGLTQSVCQNLNKLILDLIDNNLRDQGLQNLCCVLESCSNLEFLQLQLGVNKISNQGIIKFASSLTKYTKLNQLVLYFPDNQSNIGNEEMLHLCSSIKQLKEIQSLTLTFPSGRGCFSDIGDALSSCIQLSVLKIILAKKRSKNAVSKDVYDFLSQLQKSNSISKLYLDLSGNKLDRMLDLDLYSLFGGFKKLTSLALLLRHNNLGEEDISKIVSSLQNCTNLVTLKIELAGNYYIDEESIANLFLNLQKKAKLKALIVDLGFLLFIKLQLNITRNKINNQTINIIKNKIPFYQLFNKKQQCVHLKIIKISFFQGNNFTLNIICSPELQRSLDFSSVILAVRSYNLEQAQQITKIEETYENIIFQRILFSS
ncbi:hypothetical protein ABPG74_000369 [Tetrahymena malaccensis]